MNSSWFLVLTWILFGAQGQPPQYTCCGEKTVGTQSYTFVSKGDVPSACSTGCIYYKNGSPESRFCFAPGNLPVTCNEEWRNMCSSTFDSVGVDGVFCFVTPGTDSCIYGQGDPGTEQNQCDCTCPLDDGQSDFCVSHLNNEATECILETNQCDFFIE